MKDIFAQLGSYLHYGDRPKPRRDWFVLLVLGALALVVSAGWNFWLFSLVENGEPLGAVATSTTNAFNQAALDSIQKVFADRASKEATYIGGTYHFIDPSK